MAKKVKRGHAGFLVRRRERAGEKATAMFVEVSSGILQNAGKEKSSFRKMQRESDGLFVSWKKSAYGENGGLCRKNVLLQKMSGELNHMACFVDILPFAIGKEKEFQGREKITS